MLTVEITNDQTGTDESANYEYVVRVNWREIARGKVSGHNRKGEWWKLLNLVVQHATRSEPKRGAESTLLSIAGGLAARAIEEALARDLAIEIPSLGITIHRDGIRQRSSRGDSFLVKPEA